MKNNYVELLAKLRENEKLIEELDSNAKNCLTFAREAVKINPLFYGKFSENVKKDEKVIQNIIDLTNTEIFVDAIDFQDLIKNATNEEQLKKLKELSRLNNYIKIIFVAKLFDYDERKVKYQNIPESLIEKINIAKSKKYVPLAAKTIDMYYGLIDGIKNDSISDICEKLEIPYNKRTILINTIRDFIGCTRKAIENVDINEFLVIYKNESDNFFTIKESNFSDHKLNKAEQFYNDKNASVDNIETLLKLFYDFRVGNIETDNEQINNRIISKTSGLLYNFIVNKIYHSEAEKQIKKYFDFSNGEKNRFASENYTSLDRERCNSSFRYDGDFWRLNKMQSMTKPFCKLYIPLSLDNYIENIWRLSKIVNEVQKYEYENVSEAKFRDHISNDDCVFRFCSIDAYNIFMELLMENQDIIKGTTMRPSLLIPNISKIGIMPDDNGSYNSICAEIISSYINYVIKKGLVPNINGLLDYIEGISNNDIIIDACDRSYNEIMKPENESFKIKVLKILKQKIINVPDEKIISEAFDGKIKIYKI